MLATGLPVPRPDVDDGHLLRLDPVVLAPVHRCSRTSSARHDLSGLGKTGWIVFAILLPFLGVFIYLITQNVGMTERNLQRARAERDRFDDYVRQTAGAGEGGAASEIDRAKQLLDSGAITQTEFETLKQKALA